jgi:hypothetical protein
MRIKSVITFILATNTIISIFLLYGVFKLKETQVRAKAVTEAHNDLVDALLDVQCRLDSIQEGRTWIWVAPCSRKCKEAGFHH